MKHSGKGTMIAKLFFSVLLIQVVVTGPARALSVAEIYPDCKRALVLMDAIRDKKKLGGKEAASYFPSFLKCSGYINGALEMKRMLNLASKGKGPYCSPKKASLNLTVAVRLFVTFVEAGKQEKSRNPAAAALIGALRSVLGLDSALAKKYGCFPDK